MQWTPSTPSHDVLQVPLQRRLSILPCAKLVSLTMAWAYWWRCAPMGEGATCAGPLLFWHKLTDMLYNVLVYWVLLLLAKGRPAGGPSQGGAERRAPPGRPTRMQWTPSTPRLTPPPYPNPY